MREERYRVLQIEDEEFVVADKERVVLMATCRNRDYAEQIVSALNSTSLFYYDTELKSWVPKH